MNHTDWERYHRPAGVVESGNTLTVTGSGDIGPVSDEGHSLEGTLAGLVVAMLIFIVVAVRFATHESGRVLGAKAIVTGAVTFAAGLVAAAIVVPVGAEILGSQGNTLLAVPLLIKLRVIVGSAVLLALVAVLALGLGALPRRRWMAVLAAITMVVLPYVAAAVPVLPNEVARWLLRVTPAAAFAVKQTAGQYPQVVADYAPWAGYFPLPWWGGLAVLTGYIAIVFGLAARRLKPGGDQR
jgi:hypothetical protein